jgi:hypothetical protein
MPAHNVYTLEKKSQNRIRKIWLLRSANKAELMRFTAAQKPKRGFSYTFSHRQWNIKRRGAKGYILFYFILLFSDSKVIGVSLLSA